MEDWKAARVDNSEDFIPLELHNDSNEANEAEAEAEELPMSSGGEDEMVPPDQVADVAPVATVAPRRHSSGPRSQRNSSNFRHRLSIVETVEDDWEEQDAALRYAKETAYTLMDKECAADDVIRVWECVSKFITFKMLEGVSVRIAGLGTFSFRIHKTPVNQKSVKVTKAPIFILSEYVSQMYQLKQDRMLTSNGPVVPLNLSVIADHTRLHRGLIEGIITEVLQAFARGVFCNKSLEFPFPFIGKLQVRDQKVTMKFYDNFCKKLGFHVVETASEANLLSNLMPGRMTPLRLHIPSETFRSVFHLREVRSVHEFPLLVPLVEIDGRLIPETLVEKAGVREKRKTNAATQNLADNSQNQGSKAAINKPLYVPQKTGDCILNLMNSCPEIKIRCLRAHMYKSFVETLGSDVVKSHFQRRGNKGPTREFSFDNFKLNCNGSPLDQ